MKPGFTIAFSLLFINAAAQTGPGGVGAADGTTALKVWYKVDNGISTTGSAVNAWVNSAGITALDISETGAQRPTRVANAVNGYSEISFNGSNRLRTGQTLTTSNFVVDEASSFVVCRADNTTQVSSVYLTDPLESPARFSNHIPWAGSVYFDIGVCCGNDGRLEVPALSNLTNYSVWSYDANPSTGKQLYRNGALLLDRPSTSTYTGHATQRFNIGGNTTGSAGFAGDVTEVIVFREKINSAQRIIVQNYLAAKYGLSLTANDVYTMDNTANGDYDHEVAGIGRVNASNVHTASRGSGIVTVMNASGLSDNEFFMWGHNNGALQASVTTGLPSGVTARFAREWRVSEVGEVGALDLHFDLSGLADFASLDECTVALSLRLLIDSDNDGYADQTPIVGATHIGNNVYRFANVSSINNSMRFTLGIYNPPVNGPGGVGGTNGTSSLVLWLDANRISAADGATVTAWNDQSGYGNDFTSGAGAMYNRNGANGYPTLTFNGSSHYFERPFTASLSTNTFTLLSANNVSSGPDYKALISNREDNGPEHRGWVLYSVPSGDAQPNSWEFWNGNVAGWQRTGRLTSTTGTWASLTASYRAGANGKVLYINNVQDDADTHTLIPNPGQPIRVGAASNEGPANYFFAGQMGEVILYNTTLNTAQRIIVNNYLSAKYGFSLGENDHYTQDDNGQGNFDHEVAGIGRASASALQRDSRGTGRVRVLNPTSLDDNDWFFWGHNGADIEAIDETDVPFGIQRRLSRVWRVSEMNDVGNVDIYFDMTGMGPVTLADLRLLVDNNGVFATGGIAEYTAVAMACDQYAFLNIPGGTMNGRYFTLGTANSSQTPLPIELRSFVGEMADSQVRLRWITATETDNRFFTIERSSDGKHFTAIGRVEGAGTTKEERSYTFMDRQPPFGVLYYRLRQTDFDEVSSYSDIVRVENTARGTQLVVAPNPLGSSETLTLRIRHHEVIDMKKVNVRVFDIVGREIPVFSEEKADGTLTLQFTRHHPGIYLITAHSSQLPTLLTTRVLRR